MSVATPRVLTQRSLQRGLHSCCCTSGGSAVFAPVRLGVRRAASVAVSASVGPARHTTLTTQSRAQFAQVPGKRDQEAFLSQYDPLDVLALDESCTVEEIDAAFKRLSAKYGPNGPCPDPQMVDRVFRAHEILKDPGSPYYLRAHTSEVDRQRLQFQMLPRSKRQLIQLQVGLLMILLVGLAMLVISLMMRPVKRSLRAATR
ncbi:hypothetical protein DQ04_00581020 [Trypanosoma grayi]|uniref:hypothetical protein n=1 Tax=Trypanosoma grayi TaxID=71804 RepID=UPI0004F42FC7|nr:hypothetical protein DQ04_00581020 [Trypanosoma grayi]KEG14184.1 hypothetical protein DQ04_00581020 [Trypanosoma grayi]